MRVAALVVGALVLASCATDVDVASEQRWGIGSTPGPGEFSSSGPPSPPLTSPPLTSPPLTPPPVTPPPVTAPATTEPQHSQNRDPRAQSLLLVDGDVPDWTIGEPRVNGGDSYGRSNCPQVDLVRTVDAPQRIETEGRSGRHQFYSMVIDTGSEDEAIAIIDAASAAAQACPEFSDRGRPGWLELLDVPDGEWDAAGLVIASGGQPVLIGYWRSGQTIVKLRVLGPDAYEAFAVLAEVVALKLSAASDPGGVPTATSVPEFDDSEDSDVGWESHPLASMILVASDLGGPWTRFGVTIDPPLPSGAAVICGLEIPGQGSGLSAMFETDDGESTVQQSVIEAGPTLAREWIDFYELLGSCVDSEDSVFRTTYESVPTAPDRVAGADEVVTLRVVLFDEAGGVESVSLVGVVRVGDVIAQIVVTTSGAEYVAGAPVVASAVDEVTRLLELSLD